MYRDSKKEENVEICKLENKNQKCKQNYKAKIWAVKMVSHNNIVNIAEIKKYGGLHIRRLSNERMIRWLINSINICWTAGFKINKINTVTSF